MTAILDELISKAREDPLLLLELTAKYLDMAAASKIDKVVEYNERLNELYDDHLSTTPFVASLKLITDGAANFYLTNYSQALDLLARAEEAFKPGMPTDILGVIYWAMGNCNRSKGNIDLAVEYEIKASENINPDGVFALTYAYAQYQLGELHVAIHEIDEAIRYYEKALGVVMKYNSKSRNTGTTAAFRVHDGLGICYMLLNEYEKSKEYFDKALQAEGLSAAEKARALCDLGKLKTKTDDLTSAEQVLRKSLELREQNKLEDAASTSMINLANVLTKLGRADEAVELLHKAEQITEKYKALGKQISMYKSLADAYEMLDQKEKALTYFKQYDRLNNEVRNSQEHKIFNLKNKQIEAQKQAVQEKNTALKTTLDELARVKTSRKSLFFSIVTAIALVILTEAFVDPVIDSYAYNTYISLGVKVIIALMLRPMENFYERILLRRAMKMK